MSTPDPRKCPCGGTSRVWDSRHGTTLVDPDNPSNWHSAIRMPRIRRRRECQGCGRRWTTYEVHEDAMTAISQDARERLAVALSTAVTSIFQVIGQLTFNEKTEEE